MQFWLDLCRISGEYKIDKDNLEYTIMLYPPPSREAEDIERAFKVFGEELMVEYAINNSILLKERFFAICQNSAPLILGGFNVFIATIDLLCLQAPV